MRAWVGTAGISRRSCLIYAICRDASRDYRSTCILPTENRFDSRTRRCSIPFRSFHSSSTVGVQRERSAPRRRPIHFFSNPILPFYPTLGIPLSTSVVCFRTQSSSSLLLPREKACISVSVVRDLEWPSHLFTKHSLINDCKQNVQIQLLSCSRDTK